MLQQMLQQMLLQQMPPIVPNHFALRAHEHSMNRKLANGIITVQQSTPQRSNASQLDQLFLIKSYHVLDNSFPLEHSSAPPITFTSRVLQLTFLAELHGEHNAYIPEVDQLGCFWVRQKTGTEEDVVSLMKETFFAMQLQVHKESIPTVLLIL